MGRDYQINIMKKNLLLLFLLFSTVLLAQAPPQGINYQGIARDANGKALSAKSISVKFDIFLNGNVLVFSEQHVGLIITNTFGLFTAVIGSQNNASFQQINWSSGIHSIQVYIDTIAGGTNFIPIGAAQPFQSVPYALYAASAGGVNANTILSGNITPLPGTGNDGDFYIDVLTNTLYGPKAGGTWPAGVSLVGPTGPAGPQGPQGIQGIQGLQGIQGIAGLLPNGAVAGNTTYWNGSSWVTNNSNLFNNGGNIGIGTITPSQKLDILGNLRVTGKMKSTDSIASNTIVNAGTSINAALGYKFNNLATTGKYLRGNGTYIVLDTISALDLPVRLTPWRKTGTNVYLANPGDFVGIGTNNLSIFNLEVEGNTSLLRVKSNGGGIAGVFIDKDGFSSAGYVSYQSLGADRWTSGMYTNDNFAIRNWTLFKDAISVDLSTNNVGIGTSNPLEQFTVSHPSDAVIRLERSGANMNDWEMYASSFGLRIRGGQNNNGALLPDLFTIDGGGKVGIGTNTPGAKLVVAGPGIYDAAIGLQNTAGGYEWRIGSEVTGELKFVKITGATFTALTMDGNSGLVTVNDFTKLGNNAPAIKTLKLTGTSPSVQGNISTYAHGVTASKILSVDIFIDAGIFVAPNTIIPGYEYDFYINGANIEIQTKLGNSGLILQKPLKILVTYEQ